MSGVIGNWRLELVELHRELFQPADYPAAVQGSPECGAGWRPIIDRCCFRIGSAVQDHESFRFEQIRERQGSLRIYWGGRLSAVTEAAVREAIDLAEARSLCVCELCGGEGRLHRAGAVLMTRCGQHAEGNPVPVRKGYENVHLTQEVITGRLRVVVCRRYDPEIDAFIDLDTPSLAAKEA